MGFSVEIIIVSNSEGIEFHNKYSMNDVTMSFLIHSIALNYRQFLEKNVQNPNLVNDSMPNCKNIMKQKNLFKYCREIRKMILKSWDRPSRTRKQ